MTTVWSGRWISKETVLIVTSVCLRSYIYCIDWMRSGELPTFSPCPEDKAMQWGMYRTCTYLQGFMCQMGRTDDVLLTDGGLSHIALTWFVLDNVIPYGTGRDGTWITGNSLTTDDRWVRSINLITLVSRPSVRASTTFGQLCTFCCRDWIGHHQLVTILYDFFGVDESWISLLD